MIDSFRETLALLVQNVGVCIHNAAGKQLAATHLREEAASLRSAGRNEEADAALARAQEYEDQAKALLEEAMQLLEEIDTTTEQLRTAELMYEGCKIECMSKVA